MISYLKGELAGAGEGIAVVDVGGMGFRVFITDRDQADLPAVGDPVQLYTYLSVREDAIWLYGFLSEEDRQVFRQLLTVSGVARRQRLVFCPLFLPMICGLLFSRTMSRPFQRRRASD